MRILRTIERTPLKVYAVLYAVLIAALLARAAVHPKPAHEQQATPQTCAFRKRSLRCQEGCALAFGLTPRCRPKQAVASRSRGAAAATASAAAARSSSPDAERTRAASLLRRRGLENARAAIPLLRAAHARSPDDVVLRLELAEALSTVPRIITHANSIVLEGTLESPAFKRIWREYGDEALPHARAAYKARAGDVRALAAYAEAFMFSSSAKGIVQQALSGSAAEFKRFSNELRGFPSHDSSVGSCYLGCFYNVAPWPVGDRALAAEILQEGVDRAPVRRNLYYAGVNAYQRGRYSEAVDYFRRATNAACGSETERDFGEWLLRESRRGLSASLERAQA